MNIANLHPSASNLRVVSERVAKAFERVVSEMPIEHAIQALCPSHKRAERESRLAA